MSNNEKELLNELNELNDQKILSILKVYLPNYFTILDSEKEAIEILNKYGISTSFSDINTIMKNISRKLLEIAELRKLAIPIECYQYEVKTKDIIFRIEEIKNKELSFIDNGNYLHSLINKVIPIKKLSNSKYATDIEKTTKLYDKIIKAEFGEDNFELFQECKKRLHLKK